MLAQREWGGTEQSAARAQYAADVGRSAVCGPPGASGLRALAPCGHEVPMADARDGIEALVEIEDEGT